MPAAFDSEDAVRLLADLVRLPTLNPPGAELPGAELIARELERRAFRPELMEIAPNRANVIARLRGSGEAPSLLFNGHIDVVPPGELPWKHPPFGAMIEGGRLYGRGASDMKGGLAAMLIAMDALSRSGKKLRGDVLFTAVADEEIGVSGSLRLAEEGLTRGVGAVVIGEPTGFNVYIAQKGTYWVELETVGATAHGSMPHLGRNAIVDMQALLSEVLAIPLGEGPDPSLGRATLNIGTIHGGVGTNVVPDSCRAALDIRLPPGISQESMQARLEGAVERARVRLPGLEAHVRNTGSRPGAATRADDPLVRCALKVCRERLGRRQEPLPTPGYATDASALCVDPPIPFVVVGPGKEELAHKPDEYIDIEDYLNAVGLYAGLAEEFLGFAG